MGSFRHFAYQAEGKFYNGVTQDDIHHGPDRSINRIDGWSERAIAGREILVDYPSWAAEKGIPYSATSTQPISTFDETGKVGLQKAEHTWPGLEQGEAMTRWLWRRQFAAIAADNPALECIPPTDDTWMLHPILLAGRGTPIGEMFDLDAIADLCKRNDRWSFFITSDSLRYKGVIASPPNAMAIF
ncbi:cyclase-domain-containing protein [Penicillium malachiteum]|uniref:cyclase-domain-containing protein n=1 Tax=Penicillium malachiteum TaxID=1324776 RepID=UPI002546D740|nr:cyclase-domain-containing protein [Penicillium malachiteum]KAJ5734893.1 cyclase-domain-containing protein [Penicillium malachiteum]